MDDTRTLTFSDDANDLGGVIYFHCKAYGTFCESMNHTEQDAFDKHLDILINHNRRKELAQYPFLSFTRPAVFDQDKYSVEPLGQEHAEWCAANEEAKTQTAVSSAKRHFHLMWLCARPEEVEKLQYEVLMSTEDMGKIRGISDPRSVEFVREGIARTLRQVACMKRKYSTQEIKEANAFLDDSNADGRRLGLVDLD
jgi:hypothetical protein